jgi:hypothetical protein
MPIQSIRRVHGSILHSLSPVGGMSLGVPVGGTCRRVDFTIPGSRAWAATRLSSPLILQYYPSQPGKQSPSSR